MVRHIEVVLNRPWMAANSITYLLTELETFRRFSVLREYALVPGKSSTESKISSAWSSSPEYIWNDTDLFPRYCPVKTFPASHVRVSGNKFWYGLRKNVKLPPTKKKFLGRLIWDIKFNASLIMFHICHYSSLKFSNLRNTTAGKREKGHLHKISLPLNSDDK